MASLKKITAFTTLALVATLGLTGCGDDAKPASAPKGQEQAEKASTNELTADTFVQRINDAQYKAGSASMLMEMSQMGMDMEASADVIISEKPEDVAMSMTMSMPGTDSEMKMIMIGTDAYMNMGEMTQNKFAKLSLDELDGAGMGNLESQSNPAAQFELFEKALTDFKVGDTEKIDGVETTKYTLSLDTKIVVEEGGQEMTPEVSELLGDTLTYEMYVDSDDLPKRIVMPMGDGETVITFSDWGKDMKVEAPADDEIVEF